MKPKLIIFDFDGTLADSAPGIIAAIKKLIVSRNLPDRTDQEIIAAVGNGVETLQAKLFPHLAPQKEEFHEAIKEFISYYKITQLIHTTIFEGVFDFLKSYNGHKAIVSNKPAVLLEEITKITNIDQHQWLGIAGLETFELAKPDPYPLNHFMKMVDVLPHETLMIGDSGPDFYAAKAAGVPFLATTFGLTQKEELINIGVEYFFDHYNHLQECIDELPY